jgi:glycosyltransferase involved in cell wall biosynthesis
MANIQGLINWNSKKKDDYESKGWRCCMVKFSIIISAYKNKILLKNCLESLNRQKGYGRGDYEVIVVDDGSDDDTYDYIKGTNRNYFLYYVYIERSAESCSPIARNYGLRIAKGEIIIFIDQDIIVKENYLMEVERYYSVNQNILLTGTRLFLPEEVSFQDVSDGHVFNLYYFSPLKPEWHEFRYRVFDQYSYNASAIVYPWFLVFGCNMIAPKSWLEKVGGFEEGFKGWAPYDIELACKLYEAGITIAFNSMLEVLHQFHGYRSDAIPASRYPEIDAATKLFLEKHPKAINMPEETIYGLFKGWVDVDFDILGKGNAEKKVILFNDQSRLGKVKNDIFELSQKAGYEIIVKDFIETTDLDVWVQLLGHTNSVIRYFPQSKTLAMESFGCH